MAEFYKEKYRSPFESLASKEVELRTRDKHFSQVKEKYSQMKNQNTHLNFELKLAQDNDQKLKRDKEKLPNDAEKALKNCEYFKKAHAQN